MMMLGECRCNVPIHFHYYNVVRQQNIISTTTQSRILLSFLAICNYEGSLIIYIFGNKFETPNVHFVGVHIFFNVHVFNVSHPNVISISLLLHQGKTPSVFHLSFILTVFLLHMSIHYARKSSTNKKRKPFPHNSTKLDLFSFIIPCGKIKV